MIFIPTVAHSTPGTSCPATWFLASPRPEVWLDRLGCSGLADEDVTLFVLKSGCGQIVGAWVTGCRPLAAGAPAPGQPWSWIGTRLCVPADATLNPQLSSDEADGLCGRSRVFMHPTLGCKAFMDTQGLKLWQILERGPESGCVWDCSAPWTADSGPALRCIELEAPPIHDPLATSDATIIGSAPCSELPAKPGERQSGIIEPIADQIQQWVASRIQAGRENATDTDRPPDGAEGWKARVRQWAAHKQVEAERRRQEDRDREIRRLLHMLDEDPMEGLRHAIPAADLPHRGVAEKSGRLGTRVPDFNTGHLGGRATDTWMSSPEAVRLLRCKYRDLAGRELALGRFRRAAFIYAQLLGDFRSAGNTLRQGRHFREAAVVFEEHVHDRLEAARCFAEGGSIQDAVIRYEALGRTKEIAELHESVGNKDAARPYWLREVDRERSRNNPVGAAILLKERLGDAASALQELEGTWPDSAHAPAALNLRLEWLGQLGHEAQIRSILQSLRTQPVASHLLPDLLAILESHAQSCHTLGLQPLFADVMLLQAARMLEFDGLSNTLAERLMRHVTRLHPEDRLLSRDGSRWLAMHHRAGSSAVGSPGRKPGENICREVARFSLPSAYSWESVRACNHGFIALGRNAMNLLLVRGSWDGEIQKLWLPMPAEGGSCPLFTFIAQPEPAVLLLDGRFPSEREWELPSESLFMPRPCQVRRPSLLPDGPFLVSADDQGMLILAPARNELVATHYTMAGDLVSSWVIKDLQGPGQGELLGQHRLMVRWKSYYLLACDRRLYFLNTSAPTRTLEFPAPLTEVSCPDPDGSEVLICQETGASLLRWGRFHPLALDDSLSRPMGALLDQRRVVLVSPSGTGCMIRQQGGAVRRLGCFHASIRACIGVLSLPGSDRFALFSSKGQVSILQPD